MRIPKFIRRLWFNGLGGSRYYFDEPREYAWKRWRKIKRLMWFLSAIFVCRFKGHVIDGQEWGSGCGRKVDAWCSRCFFAFFEIDPDEAPWLSEKRGKVRREIFGSH